MTAVLIAVAVLGIIGALCALLLVVSSKYMRVETDEKFPALRECLPGANCGACGYAGCDGYAAALASGEEEKINKCVPGGADAAKGLSAVLGVQFEAAETLIATVCCRGDCDATQKKSDYQGAQSCTAAKLLFGGDGSCTFGCLGYGDCAAACPEGAISVQNGLARVTASRCIGCGICAKTCPQHIIALLPAKVPVYIACSSHDKGPAVRKKCTAGCIGCGLCTRKCPNGAIHMENNLSVIDYDKCTGCGTCRGVCPSKCILPGDER
ncbi:MAG: RnfABCDGE type electron transport complex subunit B [Oscillospiraceae bacterium]|nr:RnfABCDGE type electron transport complex subunit B [Oscillospiraceae bacterium]